MFAGIAQTKLSDVLRPKPSGEPVNAHVVESIAEPQPDFAAMQRLILDNDIGKVLYVQHVAAD